MTLVRKKIEPPRTHKWNAFCTRCHVVCVCVAYYVNSVCIYYKINGNSFFCLVIFFFESVEIEFTLTHTRVYKPHSFFYLCCIYLYTELCHAATKIQASFRGHMTRKQQAGGKDELGATASGLTSKDESLESQLKNVNINKVHKYIIHNFLLIILNQHMIKKCTKLQFIIIYIIGLSTACLSD